MGIGLAPDDIVTTCGGQNAVRLCLEAVTRPGDTVAIETPTYFGLLEMLESLHLRALEVPTYPSDGICLDALEEAMRRHRVAACVLCPTYGNPLGHCMPDEKKKRLAALLERADVPLVEDDVYGDLSFEPRRPPPVKAFDTHGNVLLCSSFSKTLAPGFRVGWAAPGRYRRAVERLKFNSMLAVPTLTQLAVAGFLEEGGYDRHLRRLRRSCADWWRAPATRCRGRSPPARASAARAAAACCGWSSLPASTRCVSTSRRAPTDRDRARPDLLRHRALPELHSAGRRDAVDARRRARAGATGRAGRRAGARRSFLAALRVDAGSRRRASPASGSSLRGP